MDLVQMIHLDFALNLRIHQVNTVTKLINIFYLRPSVIYLKGPFELNFSNNLPTLSQANNMNDEKPNILSRKIYMFFFMAQSSRAVSSNFNLDSPGEVLRGHIKRDGKDKWMATVILKADFSLWLS